MSHQQVPDKALEFLAISGSLRTGSSNTLLLRAAAVVAPDNVSIVLYDALADLPPFNPDHDGDEAPPPVMDFRARLQACDGVLICSPEYAHGVPGTLKNALDWIVSSGDFTNKPVALLNASPRSIYAQASLTETLTVMMAAINTEASIAVTLPTNKGSMLDILSNPEASSTLRNAIVALARSVQVV